MAVARARQAKQRTFSLGPWKGVRDVGDAGAQRADYLQDAINCLFLDPQHDAEVEARPGFTKVTAAALNAGANIGCLINYGFNFLFATAGTKLYRAPLFTPGTWTDVTPVGVTISGTMHAVRYGDELIFSSSAGKPFRGTNLTATPITGTNIEIDSTPSAWIARGAPTVYGGKLFFVVDTIAGTLHTTRFVWSEEASAGTGYLQSGFTNKWDLIQNGSDTLLALVGTNTALYYFRINSIGAITGVVNSTFATSSTHDSVSQKIGALAHKAILHANGYIWFLSYEGFLYRFRVGTQAIENLSDQMRNRIRKVQSLSVAFASNAMAASATYIAELNKVVVGGWMAESGGGSTASSRNLYVFDGDTGSYEGRWIIGLSSQPANETPNAVLLGSTVGGCVFAAPDLYATDTAGRVVLWVAGTDVSGGAGHIWRQSFRTQSTYGDDGAAMHMSATSMRAFDEHHTEYQVDELAVEKVPDTATISLDYYAPRGSSTGLALTGAAASDSIQSSHDDGIARAGLGPRAFGRWFRAVLHWNVPAGTTQYAIERASILARPQKAGPRAP